MQGHCTCVSECAVFKELIWEFMSQKVVWTSSGEWRVWSKCLKTACLFAWGGGVVWVSPFFKPEAVKQVFQWCGHRWHGIFLIWTGSSDWTVLTCMPFHWRVKPGQPAPSFTLDAMQCKLSLLYTKGNVYYSPPFCWGERRSLKSVLII